MRYFLYMCIFLIPQTIKNPPISRLLHIIANDRFRSMKVVFIFTTAPLTSVQLLKRSIFLDRFTRTFRVCQRHITNAHRRLVIVSPATFDSELDVEFARATTRESNPEQHAHVSRDS